MTLRLDTLPSDVLSLIASHLPLNSIDALSQTSKRFAILSGALKPPWISPRKHVSNTSSFWCELYRHRFGEHTQWDSFTWRTRFYLRDQIDRNWLFVDPPAAPLIPAKPPLKTSHLIISSPMHRNDLNEYLHIARSTFLTSLTLPQRAGEPTTTATASPITALTAHLDRLAYATSDHNLALQDPDNPADRRQVRTRQTITRVLASLAPFNRVSAGGSDATIRVFDVRARRHLAALHGQGGPVTGLAATRGGTALLSSGWKRVRLWDLQAGRCTATLQHEGLVSGFQASADGEVLYAALPRSVYVWDLRTRRTGAVLTRPAAAPDAPLRDLAVGPDGTLYARCGAGVAVWDGRGSWEGRLWGKRGGGRGETLTCIALSEGGELVLGGCCDGKVKVFGEGDVRVLWEGVGTEVTKIGLTQHAVVAAGEGVWAIKRGGQLGWEAAVEAMEELRNPYGWWRTKS